ncbi:T9SS type A sorting domain-containing protein, partial [candidate division TA06 bacterium]|nr:T9SS type A sorting domain-containing protein [candidate division TA06 bacterium]
IISGGTFSFGAGGGDVYLIKTDSLGDTLWTKTFGDTLDDLGYSVQQTSDGGYIIAGCRDCFSLTVDLYLIKTDSLGNMLWTRIFDGPADEGGWGFSVQETSDNGYIITGISSSFVGGSTDIYLIKTDNNGQVVGVEEKGFDKFKMKDTKLLQNQPNPFHSTTLIRYILPNSQEKIPVRLAIYDISGRLVETLVDQDQESGVFTVIWEGKDQASGIYFYRLHSRFGQEGEFTATKKLILLR